LWRVAIPFAILAVGGVGYLALTVGTKQSESEPVAPPKIRTTVTELAVVDYPVSVRTHAIVQPRNHVTITAEVTGRIAKIHPRFEVGSYFSKGDVLVELEEDDVTQQEISYENALANKILAASQVEVAKTSIKEYVEGTYQTELATRGMALVVAETNLKSAKDMHAHAKNMFRKGYVSSLELGSKADTVKHAELEVKARRTELDVFKNITKTKVLQELEANLNAAQARLAAEEAALKLEKQRLGREQLRAAFDGRVIAKAVGLGQRVGPQTVLGEVVSVDYAEVRLPLSRRDLQFLDLPELGDDEPLEVELRDAIDEKSDNTWSARIVRTEGMLDQGSLEIFAIAVIEDPFGLHSQHPVLRMGQPVTAAIRGTVLKNVIKVPRNAVSQLNQVFVVDKEQLTLSQRTIQPLWSDDNFMIIRDPTIQHGDLLATTNLVYAPEGSPVEIIPDAVAGDVALEEGVLATAETKETSQR
jgi:multidrug efflux pump subunit AcrA (membrane-fusion protein)